MDKLYQASIVNVLLQSDMADKMLVAANVKPTHYEEPTLFNGEHNPQYDPSSSYLHRTSIDIMDVAYSQPLPLSETWIANSILVFTILDGWVEDTFNMAEGDSFSHKLKEL